MPSKRDFFISYSREDRSWAEWIAWQLETAGYSVALQAWDFRPGTNFVLEMSRAAEAETTIAVLSASYLESIYTQSEWAAFAADPLGERRRFLPIRVEPCEPKGLLQAIVYIDLVGQSEADARRALLAGIQVGRRNKPSSAPAFPAGERPPDRPSFPADLGSDRGIVDRKNLFLAYSLKDEKIAVNLRQHLSLLKRTSLLSGIVDYRVSTDGNVGGPSQQIEDAVVVIPIVSADFLASGFVDGPEMRRVIAQHDRRRAL